MRARGWAVPAARRDRKAQVPAWLNSPAGAGRPEYRVGPRPRNYAQAPADPGDRAPGGVGAWRNPTPAAPAHGPRPGPPCSAAAGRSAGRPAGAAREPAPTAPGWDGRGGYWLASSQAPLALRAGRDPRRPAAATSPPFASPGGSVLDP